MSGAVASTARGRIDGSIVARIRRWASPSSVSTLTPRVRASGDESTSAVNSSGWVAMCWTSSQHVTSHSPTDGTYADGILGPQPLVDRVRVAFQILDGDRLRERGHHR